MDFPKPLLGAAGGMMGHIDRPQCRSLQDVGAYRRHWPEGREGVVEGWGHVFNVGRKKGNLSNLKNQGCPPPSLMLRSSEFIVMMQKKLPQHLANTNTPFPGAFLAFGRPIAEKSLVALPPPSRPWCGAQASCDSGDLGTESTLRYQEANM